MMEDGPTFPQQAVAPQNSVSTQAPPKSANFVHGGARSVDREPHLDPAQYGLPSL